MERAQNRRLPETGGGHETVSVVVPHRRAIGWGEPSVSPAFPNSPRLLVQRRPWVRLARVPGLQRADRWTEWRGLPRGEAGSPTPALRPGDPAAASGERGGPDPPRA